MKNHTIIFENRPAIISYASVVGKKEGEGPLAARFDEIFDDTLMGEDSWEKAESSIQKNALRIAMKKAGLTADQIDCTFAGDLLNQCVGSAFGLREFGIPQVGLYGACSTMALSLAMASIFVSFGAVNTAAAVTSSHFCSAERQFRFPITYGGQRTPTSQWTVTGAGSVIVSKGNGPQISAVTIGKIVDLGVTDANNMGAAMAPAAADTIKDHIKSMGAKPSDYDLILTGDLGKIGRQLLIELLDQDNFSISENHDDCGLLIYDLEKQDVHAGGSGCGCSGSVLCSDILKRFEEGTLNRLLFCATGALMSTTSSQQGESIPGIAHAVEIVK